MWLLRPVVFLCCIYYFVEGKLRTFQHELTSQLFSTRVAFTFPDPGSKIGVLLLLAVIVGGMNPE